MQLIAQWRLTVLRVELDLTGSVPAVQVELSSRPDGVPRTLRTWRYPLAEFGVTDRREPPPLLTVPTGLPDEVAAAVGTELDDGDLPPDRVLEPALWLRLVPPYGYLGAVPWEQALAAVGLPSCACPTGCRPRSTPAGCSRWPSPSAPVTGRPGRRTTSAACSTG